MVDVVGHVAPLGVAPHLQQVLDGFNEVARFQGALVQGRVQAQLDVELEPAHAGEVVPACVQEHPAEQRGGRLQGGRIARAQLLVDFDQGAFGVAQRVLAERLAEGDADVVEIGEEEVQFGDARV